ncbi:MAG: hypothetical protein P8X42_16145 [Calditrichaceae bacterium]
MPNLTFKGDLKQKLKVGFLIASIVSLFFFPQALFFPYSVLYMLSGVFLYFFGKNGDENSDDEED